MEDHGKGHFTAWVEKLIPRGADCCHFIVQRREDHENRNPWHIYSDELNNKAMEKLKRKG
jgi:hypothetical protein